MQGPHRGPICRVGRNGPRRAPCASRAHSLRAFAPALYPVGNCSSSGRRERDRQVAFSQGRLYRNCRQLEDGRFCLNTKNGNLEAHLVAEGLRKLAMIARLIATGSLIETGSLFRDEPEPGVA